MQRERRLRGFHHSSVLEVWMISRRPFNSRVGWPTLTMATTDDERNARKLNRIAYANIALGLLTFFLWAVPGPGYVPTFWEQIEHEFRGTSDPVAATMATVFKVAIVVVVVAFWLLSILSVTNGILIFKRRRHRLCMILSGVSLLGTPLHLILGILSLVTLNKARARSLFANVKT